MGNRQLITGAGAIAPKFVDYGKGAFSSNPGKRGMSKGEAMGLAREAKLAADDAALKGYISGLNTEMDLVSLSDAEQASIKGYLFEQKKEYARLANETMQLDALSPLFLENKNKMDAIKQSFINLKGQTDKFKERKIQYLDDFENGRLSKGNKTDDYSRASKVYGGGALTIDPNGGINIITDNGTKFTKYSDVSDPFLKDFKTADEILEQNNKLYTAGVELDASKEALLRNKLKSQLSQDGSLESIVEDGLINNERLDVDLESYETREAAINDVAEILLQGYRDSAIAGKKEKDIKKGKITSDVNDDDELTPSDTYLGYERNSQKDKNNFKANWADTQSIAQQDAEFMKTRVMGNNNEAEDYRNGSKGAAVMKLNRETGKLEIMAEPKASSIRSQKWYSSFDSKKYRGEAKSNQRWQLAPAMIIEAGGPRPVTVWRANSNDDWQILKEEDYQKEFSGTAGLEGGASQFNN